MRFIDFLFFISVFCFFSCSRREHSVSDFPPYKLILDFSEKLKKETGLVLFGYGVNNNLQKCYEIKNGVANFGISYYLFKERQDAISLEEARNLLVYVVESFLNEINGNEVIRSELDLFPFTSDFIKVSIHFVDKNKIDLGRGVAYVYFSRGKIDYEKYDIEEYREVYPAIGKHSIIHQESYRDALDIVKRSNHIYRS